MSKMARWQVLALLLCAAVTAFEGWAALTRYVFRAGLLLASSALAGAIGGLAGAGSGPCRALRLSRRASATRGALGGVLSSLVMAMLGANSDRWLMCAFVVVVGVLSGYFTAKAGGFLSPPELSFAAAIEHAREGRHDDAREALREYLEDPTADREHAFRAPLARRYLAGKTTSLEMVTELEAAAAPAGKGTEPEAASAPAGKGTEPEAGTAVVDAGSAAARSGARRPDHQARP